jgi:hypothetical protein
MNPNSCDSSKCQVAMFDHNVNDRSLRGMSRNRPHRSLGPATYDYCLRALSGDDSESNDVKSKGISVAARQF